MLLIWTSANAVSIREALELPFSRIDTVPDHNVVPFVEGQTLVAEEGDVVLVMGSKTLNQLQSVGVVPKNRTVDSLRQSKIVGPKGGVYLTTLDPFLVRTRSDAPSLIRQDVTLACRLAVTGSMEPQLGDYRYVDTLEPLCQRLWARIKKGERPELAVDLETIGLYPEAEGVRIVTIQFSDQAGMADVYYVPEDGQPSPEVRRHIKWLLTTPEILVTGANLKFDIRWMLRHWDIYCTNFTCDTLLLGSLLDENRSNSLKSHAWDYTSLGGYDQLEKLGYEKGEMHKIPPEILLPYAGCDTDVTLQSARKMKAELSNDSLSVRLYQKIVHPASRGFELMEHEGVLVDIEKMTALRHEVSEEIAKLEAGMLELLPNRLKAKYKDNLSITRPALLKDYFFTPYGLNLKPRMHTAKSGQPSTAKAHLMMFHDNEVAVAFVDLLSRHGSASKTRSTFIDGFMKHIRADGRLHPSYMLFAGSMYDTAGDDSGTVCVTRDTLFLTDKGYVTYDDLKPHTRVVTHTGKLRPVLKKIDNGVKQVLRVHTAMGHCLDATYNHPFLTPDGWVDAANLNVGDQVYVLGDAEEWRVVEGWPYQVSSWGRVRTVSGRLLKPQKKGGWGHLKVCLSRNNAKKRGPDRKDFPIHRLVASHFVPNPDGLPEVRHISGQSGVNVASNLCWGSPSDNRRDMAKHCTGQGAHANQAKMTWEGVSLIRASKQIKDQHFATEMGVSRELVRDIRLGLRWVEKTPQDDFLQFSLTTVSSVTDMGEQHTFGLEVAIDHSHVTNGIVTHNTGRTSCKDPAFQTLPKKTAWAKRLRECYPAPPGYQILQLDFAQGELKVVACVCNEANMIGAFRSGLDLHCVTGAEFMGLTYEEFQALKETDPYLYNLMRTGAKAGNFGLLYGMQAAGFREYARVQYGFTMTELEAEERRHKFLYELYPELPNYHQGAADFARKHGYIESPFGRRRHLPLIHSPDNRARSDSIRQAINAPIQSTLNDMTFLALVAMQRQIPELRFFGMIHDALYAYVPEDNAVELSHKAVGVMSNLPLEAELGWRHQLKFNADGELGPVLSHLKEL